MSIKRNIPNLYVVLPFIGFNSLHPSGFSGSALAILGCLPMERVLWADFRLTTWTWRWFHLDTVFVRDCARVCAVDCNVAKHQYSRFGACYQLYFLINGDTSVPYSAQSVHTCGRAVLIIKVFWYFKHGFLREKSRAFGLVTSCSSGHKLIGRLWFWTINKWRSIISASADYYSEFMCCDE
jgi:hypothetical protein